ncbi:MAG: BrnA antitoxin family protein [Chloroflexota bacterium]|nr:BrnA antitoxin family protein [Chloroflexota bacterium]
MRPKEPIPKFASYEEEAEFWDTHDVTDYWDDFEPTDLRFSPDLRSELTIPIDSRTLSRLQEAASSRGIAIDTLLQSWIHEHLEAQHTAASSSD